MSNSKRQQDVKMLSCVIIHSLASPHLVERSSGFDQHSLNGSVFVLVFVFHRVSHNMNTGVVLLEVRASFCRSVTELIGGHHSLVQQMLVCLTCSIATWSRAARPPHRLFT